MTNPVIPAQAVEAAAKVIYSDGWDGAPYWESMADDNSDKVHHRAIAQHALEAAAPHMLAPLLTLADERDKVHGKIRGHITTQELRTMLGAGNE